MSQDKWFNQISDYRQLEKIHQTCFKTLDDKWDYSLARLEFKDICLERHARPSFITKLAADGEGISRLILSITCQSTLSYKENIIVDPILSLGTKLLVQFEYIDPSNPQDFKVLQSSLHLDKHDHTKATNTLHPLYHYEFGGSEITKAENFNFGDFILIDTPRIMHPPLDIFLAIDFIIKHYYKYDSHKSLTEKPLYKRHIANAQKRLWRPYAIMFASIFHDFGETYSIDSNYAKRIIHC